jgi:hypothetical protein
MEFCYPVPIEKRIENAPTKLAHRCVGLKSLRPVIDFEVAPSLAAFDEIAVSEIFPASIIQRRKIRHNLFAE